MIWGKIRGFQSIFFFQPKPINTLINSAGYVTVTRNKIHSLERNTTESSGELQRTQTWVKILGGVGLRKKNPKPGLNENHSVVLDDSAVLMYFFLHFKCF